MDDINYENIGIEDIDSDVKQVETVQYVEVTDVEEEVIEIDEAFSSLGGTGEAVTHNSLQDRDLDDQHPIKAITNLSNILEEITKTKNLYAIDGGVAEFRQWLDDPYDDGYFVSLIRKNKKDLSSGNLFVDICNKDKVTKEITDVYGVTVTQSALCGNYKEKINNYTMVCLLGSVKVRVTTKDYDDIALALSNGNVYVVPGERGYAKKSESGVGFKVLSTGQKSGVGDPWYYVEIALVPQNDNISRVMEKIQVTQDNIDDMVIQIGGLKDTVDENITISGQFKDLQDAFDKLETGTSVQLQTSQNIAKQAQDVVKQAETHMEDIRDAYISAVSHADQAQKAVNGVLGDIKDLKDNIEPLASWEKNGDKGVAGFVARANQDHTELSSLTNAFGRDGSDITSIVQKIDANGASIQHLVAHVDKYTLGKRSPTHNLSLDETAILSGEHIYVPTEQHQESSYIYKHILKNDIKKGSQYFFVIQEQNYVFITPKNYDSGTVLEYNSRVKQLTVEAELIEIKHVSDTEGMIMLNFEIEYIFPVNELNGEGAEFEVPMTPEDAGYSYIWRYCNDRNRYEWHKYKPLKLNFDVSDKNDGDLWHCVLGLYEGDKCIYEPHTLYCWDEGYLVWRAVASINDNKMSTTIGLVKQASDKLTSTYTNLKGDLSSIQQDVDEIRTLVKDQGSGTLSSIEQTAEQIMMGTYSPNGLSSLGLLLDGMMSTSTNIDPIFIKTVADDWASKGYQVYATPPIWDGEKFVFGGDPDKNAYPAYFFVDGKDTYYAMATNSYEYDVYGVNNLAMTHLGTRVSDTESAVESWTRFRKGQNETITSNLNTSDADGATMSSMVFGDFRQCMEIKTELTAEEIAEITTQRYTKPPIWEDKNEDGKKEFVFEGYYVNDGEYCLAIDNSIDNPCYYKLIYGDKSVIGYEKYKMKSSGYASIMQKVDEDGSIVGLTAGNDDVEGKIFIDTINNDTSRATIAANKIRINGTTTFADILNTGKTTISGEFIQSGVIRSNNYQGADVKKMYSVKISYPKIYNGEESDYIYYVKLTAGTTYKMLLNPDAVYYIGSNIVDNTSIDYFSDSECVSKNQDGFYECKTSCYMISESDFEVVGLFNDRCFEGLAINLNDGKIVSKNFVLDEDGITLDGNIKLNGSITWAAQSNPVKVLYAENNIQKPLDEEDDGFTSYEDYPIADTDGWHKIYCTEDYYASYSYNDGYTWTEAIKIQGEDGQEASVTHNSVFRALTDDGDKQGLFYYPGADGFQQDNAAEGLYINAEYIRGTTVSGLTIQSGAFDPADSKKMINLLQMKDGVFSVYTSSEDQYPKFQLGYGQRQVKVEVAGGMEYETKTDVPYMLFGAGNGEQATDLYNVSFYENQGVILKDAMGWNFIYFPSDYSKGEQKFQQILFMDRTSQTDAYISFGNSNVNFTGANVSGLTMSSISEFSDLNMTFGCSKIAGTTLSLTDKNGTIHNIQHTGEVPYIVFGAKNTAAFPKSAWEVDLYGNQAGFFHTKGGFEIVHIGADSHIQRIWFRNNSSTSSFGEGVSHISFYGSRVDFADADVRGLKATFG